MINNHIKVADITQYSILTVKQFEHLQTTALYHLLTLAFSLFYCVLVCISGIMPVMNHLSLKWSTLTSTILCPIISSIHTMLIYLMSINISWFKQYLFKTMKKYPRFLLWNAFTSLLGFNTWLRIFQVTSNGAEMS